MRTKPFSELRKRIIPERRAKNKTLAQLMLLHINLLELQEYLEATESDLGTNLDISRSALQKIEKQLENQEDIQISTLIECFQALGENLKIILDFSE